MFKTLSAAVFGIDAYIVDVEVDIGPGDHGVFNVVGLPDNAVRESRERVRAALRNSGFETPGYQTITVNLAPADVRKEGSAFDLPIALGLLGCQGSFFGKILDSHVFLGELSLDGRGLIGTRPFRSPHHTISDAGLIGGGAIPRPGEVSLGHNGVLFLDELPEFQRNVLEVMRQPLEDGCVTIARAALSVSFPSRFMLAAAMNPCPCGFFGDPTRNCACSPPQIQRYVSKISGPLLDRIDIHIEVPAVKYKELRGREEIESSDCVRERVVRARMIQLERFRGEKIYANSQMPPRLIRKHCAISAEGEKLLENAIARLGLSARAHDRILKVSRTIADLDAAANIEPRHLGEAIQYRALDRTYWA